MAENLEYMVSRAKQAVDAIEDDNLGVAAVLLSVVRDQALLMNKPGTAEVASEGIEALENDNKLRASAKATALYIGLTLALHVGPSAVQ